MIRVENLCKSFTSEILRNVNAEINKGDVISIIGPSGCGKSTFLRCLNLLTRPTSGKIYIDDQDITAADKRELARIRRKVGMVFQSFNLFSHLTVIENVMLSPVRLLGMDKQSAYDEGMKLLKAVGLEGKALHYPEALSGGQKQLVAIARTLAMKPEVVLFDEPTSALDPTMVSEVLGVIQRLADRGLTMLIVTHEMNFAEQVSNRVFYMDEMGIYEEGTPEQIFRNPQKPKTQEFIYKIRSFTYDIHSASFDFYQLLGQAVTFMKNQRFDEKRNRDTVLLGEELIFHRIFPAALHENADYRLTLRYAQKLDTAQLVFEGDAIPADLSKQIYDDISEKIVRSIAKEIKSEAGKLTVLL